MIPIRETSKITVNRGNERWKTDFSKNKIIIAKEELKRREYQIETKNSSNLIKAIILLRESSKFLRNAYKKKLKASRR